MLAVIAEKRGGIVFDTTASLRYKQHQEWPWLALYSTLLPCSPHKGQDIMKHELLSELGQYLVDGSLSDARVLEKLLRRPHCPSCPRHMCSRSVDRVLLIVAALPSFRCWRNLLRISDVTI